MTNGRVTLADVAGQASVSRTTASFVLSGRDAEMRISAEARRRVLDAAEKLGYRPNLTARSLRTSTTGTIGLISDTIATTQFAGEVIHGALDAALAHDRMLFIAETGGDATVEAGLIDAMLDRQVDGLIYASMFTRDVTPPDSLLGRPLMLLNCLADGLEVPSVIPDEIEAGRSAARALLDAGHHKDVFVIGEMPDEVFAARERMQGLTQEFQQARAHVPAVVDCFWDRPETGYDAVRSLLADGQRPSGLICCNDRLALGAYQALSDSGLSIPNDVSVVSFDDSDLASWLRPQLTSVALPHYELGRTAVELLVADRLDPVVHRLPMPLRPRESVAVSSA